MNRHGSLNRIFRLVWSQVSNSWVAVAETAKGRGKGKNQSRKLVATALALSAVTWLMPEALAGPSGGKVVSGSASIAQQGSGTTITQSSGNALLTWKTFDVAGNESVNFIQPSATAVAVNEIFSANGSSIMGTIKANGEIFLINPNGIVFGKSAQVNVGGLVASGLGLNNPNDGGSLNFKGSGTVNNQGSIRAGSYAVLLGSSVSNEGTVSTTPFGTIILGAGNNATLTLNNAVSLKINAGTVQNLVSNGGAILADGGSIILTAGAKNDLLASAVNNTGLLQARTVSNTNGTISLLADMNTGVVNVGGTLDASAPNGGNGGAIETSAAAVRTAAQFTVNTRAAGGKTGSWLIDPADFTIAASGGDMSGAALSGALGSSDVVISTNAAVPCSPTLCTNTNGSNGDINVNDAVGWGSSHALTLNAWNNINVNQPISLTGSGTLNLVYGQSAANLGNTSAIHYNAPINLTNTSIFTTQQGNDVGPTGYVVVNSVGAAGVLNSNDGTLQGMALNGAYVLGSDIDATATPTWNGGAGFTPIGSPGSPASEFTGIFNGLGHSITGLFIHPGKGSASTGLFGATGYLTPISNVALVNVDVTGPRNVGALVGYGYGSVINNCSASGTVSGSVNVGGLVGQIISGYISNSSANVSVTGASYGNNIGGLVGYGKVSTLSNLQATGAVAGAGYTGGLIGQLWGGTLTNATASGSVTGIAGTVATGGLVGQNYGGTISTSTTNTGTVSGAGMVGGLIGQNSGGTINFGTSSETVTANGNYGAAGGLVGSDTYRTASQLPSQINNSSASGTVSGTSLVGGLIGIDYGAKISNSFATGNVTGNSAVGGLIGNAYQTTVTNDTLALSQSQPTSATVTGWDHVGGLIGASTNGNISNSVATGAVNGTAYGGTGSYVGGLVGASYGSNVSNSVASGTVTSYNTTHNGQGKNVGGLVGWSDAGSAINNSSSSSIVVANFSVGGLVGANYGAVNYGSHTTGTVTGVAATGGLVGNNQTAVINHSFASGTVNGVNDTGGLVGTSAYNSTISNSYALGTVNGTNYVGGLIGALRNSTVNASYSMASVNGTQYVGGLVGKSNQDTISASYATGQVNGTQYVGGLVGYAAYSNIDSSYATGNVTGSGAPAAGYLDSDVGGLLGFGVGEVVDSVQLGSVSNSYATGNVQADAAQVGGLIGYFNYGVVTNSHATGNVSVGGSATAPTNSVGGLIGYLDGNTTVSNSYSATGTVTANFGYGVGGLAGRVVSGAAIANSYSTENVTGTFSNTGGLVGVNNGTISQSFATGQVSSSSYAGGLVGTNTGAINDSYATGSVTAHGSVSLIQGDVGGLVGSNFGEVNRSYSSGLVTADPTATYVGGLIGFDGNLGTKAVTDSYWDIDRSGQTISGGGTGAQGVHTADMMNPTSFDWNFATTWFMYAGQTTPLLRSFMTPLMLNANNDDPVYNGTAYTGASVNIPAGTDMTKLLGTPTFIFTDASNTPTTPVNVGTYNIIPSGYYSGQLGYLISYGNAVVDIQQAPVQLTSTGQANNKAYDGTTTASISAAQFDSSAIFAKDVGNVSLTDSGMFASANAGTGINVSAIYALTGPDAGNYSLVIPRNGKTKGVTLTADITPAQLTVQNEVAANKNYDGTTAAALSNGTLVGVVSGESVGLSEAGNFISAGPGNGIGVVTNDSLTGTASVLANYTLTQPSTLANPTIFANITQSSNVLTVIGTKVSTKTYNGTTTATVTGGTLSCAPNCNGVTLSQSGHFNSADAGSAVGVTVTDKITGTNAKNYTLQEPTNVTGTINPKTVTVSGVKGTGFVYDTSTTDPLTGTPVLSGLVTGQALTVSNYSVGTLASPNYGTEAVTTNMMLNSTATGNASDYVLTQPKLSVTISKDPIVATSTTDNKTYDGTTAGTATPLLYSGTLYNGDTLTGGKYTFNSANAGTRTLLISGVTTTADSEDYSITYHNTTNDVISPIQLYYTATPTPIPVGGTVPTLSGTITGTFASGQTLANQSTGTAVWKLTTALPKGNPQGYYGITGSGIKLDNGNYKLSQSASNATSLCIGEQSCPQPPLQMLKVNLTQQKPIAGAANPLPQIETVLESVPLPQDSVKTRLPGLHIRGVGVKLPGDTVAMN